MLFPSRSNFLKRVSRNAAARSRGRRPVVCRKARRRVAAVVPSLTASTEKRTLSSSDCANSRAACSTSATEPATSFGRQRRQGREPCCSASAPVRKKTTLRRSERRAGHDGLQQMCVARTPSTKVPPPRASPHTPPPHHLPPI